MESWAFAVYGVVAVWVCYKLGHVLYQTGFHLLYDVFEHKKAWVLPINNILLCGFYLVNIGLAILCFRFQEPLYTMLDVVEFLTVKLGGLLLLIGGMHTFNVLFFFVLKWYYFAVKDVVNN